jgi:hypothetical protein
MVEWLSEMVLVIAGAIADWFIVRDSPNFELVQMTVGILLVILVVAIATFSPFLVRRFRTRREREDRMGS